MAKKKCLVPDVELAYYDAIIGNFPEVVRKGATSAYTSVNGHMYSFVDKEGVLALRLSKEDKADFEAKYKTGPVMAYGSVMNGYVPVPAELFANTVEISKFFKKSLTHFSSIKPKPTKKKK